MGSVGKSISAVSSSAELSEEQMVAEMNAEFDKIDDRLERFLSEDPSKHRGNFIKLEEEYGYIESYTLAQLKKDYLKAFNKAVDDFGDGFEVMDSDDHIDILYKPDVLGNQKYIRVDTQDWPENKKIPLQNIDSIIVNGGWGTAFAGNSIQLYNDREAVDYGRWGYRNTTARYNDENDIRVDFSENRRREVFRRNKK